VSSVNRLAELQEQMTRTEGGFFHPGAILALDELYSQYGLPGIEALNTAGYRTCVQVYEFYNDICNRSVSEMATRLGL
jgi:hypothetical protein